MLRKISAQAYRLFALGVFLFSITAHSAPQPSWPQLARQVGMGETEKTRLAAVRSLRAMKNLNTVLLEALETPNRSLALDVIAALDLNSLVPTLLERVSADEDGFLVLTLNSLLNNDNKANVLTAYADVIGNGRTRPASAAAIVGMLEPLGRLGIVLPKSTVSALLEHEFDEVRSATLLYVRVMTLTHGRYEYTQFGMKAFRSAPFQLRLQALFLMDEFTRRAEAKESVDIPAISNLCDKEKAPAVKTRCHDLVQGKRLKR
jgi:hypothetical protein